MSSKKQRTQPPYELLYHPGIPGRGEFIRLAFELTGTPYKDVCNEQEEGAKGMYAMLSSKDSKSYPLFAPPILRVLDNDDNDEFMIHQTANILIYLAGKIGLEGGNDDKDQAVARQIMLTALDLNDEAHNTHHPVDHMAYYDDQKDEALRTAVDFRKNRIPKFFAYFESALKANEAKGSQKACFVGEKASIADIAVWQVVDGLKFAFPKELAVREKEFPFLCTQFYPAFKKNAGIEEYLASDRRLKYSNGIFRYYPELDRQD